MLDYMLDCTLGGRYVVSDRAEPSAPTRVERKLTSRLPNSSRTPTCVPTARTALPLLITIFFTQLGSAYQQVSSS